MTGHLVFSTIHTNDAPSSVTRLTEMGAPAFMVASTLKAVLAQRLVRRICAQCKEARDPTPDEREVFKQNQVELPKGKPLYSGKGCDVCGKTGYKGRAGIHEILVMTDALREQAIQDSSTEALRKPSGLPASWRIPSNR